MAVGHVASPLLPEHDAHLDETIAPGQTLLGLADNGPLWRIGAGAHTVTRRRGRDQQVARDDRAILRTGLDRDHAGQRQRTIARLVFVAARRQEFLSQGVTN